MIKKNSEDYNSRDAAQRTLLVALHNRSVDLDHILEEARRELLAIHPDVLLEVLLDREMVVEQLAVQSDLRARLFHHVVVLGRWPQNTTLKLPVLTTGRADYRNRYEPITDGP